MSSDDAFSSSDSARSGRPLRHLRTAVFSEPLHLEGGGVLPGVTVAYETYGELNDRRDNAVLICHALSGDSHVARHDPADDDGWWDLVVGPGKSIDTDQYFVLCPNILGGCRGTTGPNSVCPDTGRPYGRRLPRRHRRRHGLRAEAAGRGPGDRAVAGGGRRFAGRADGLGLGDAAFRIGRRVPRPSPPRRG